MRQLARTPPMVAVVALLLLTATTTTTAATCPSGAACACTSDATCVAVNSTTTTTTTTATLFATGGRCDEAGACRLASGFWCGVGNASTSLQFVAADFLCRANAECQCRAGSLNSCSVLDDAARALTCSADSLSPSDACPLVACRVAEPPAPTAPATIARNSTTTTGDTTTTEDSCHSLPGCIECQARADCVYCGKAGCVATGVCSEPDAASVPCVESFWNDTTTAIVAAVVIAGVLVLILCIVAAVTTQRTDEPVQDPFVLEMRSVSETDRIALVKKDLRDAEAAEKAKINAADAADDSALTESE